jgi:predicted nucleotidyltransferase
MGTLADMLAVLCRERARLFARYGLKSMAVFGPATRDDFRSDSDVDKRIEVERPIGIGSSTSNRNWNVSFPVR